MPDVFITYTHQDERDPPGWVSEFEQRLVQRVHTLTGLRLDVYRDNQRPANLPLEELMKKLRSSRALIIIHSPRYTESEWCEREVGGFVAEMGSQGLFKVEKLFFDVLNHHPALQDHTGYQFWTGTREHPRELFPPQIEYHQALTALAYDLGRCLNPPKQQKGNILLLHEGSDRTRERNVLKARLEAAGYAVHMPARRTRVRDDAELVALLPEIDVAVVLFGKAHSAELERDFDRIAAARPTIASFPDELLDAAQRALLAAIERAQDDPKRRVRLWPPPLDEIESEIQSLLPKVAPKDRPKIYVAALEGSVDVVDRLKAKIDAQEFELCALTDDPQRRPRMERHKQALAGAHGALIVPSDASREFAPSILGKIREAEALSGAVEKAFVAPRRAALPAAAAPYDALIENEAGFDAELEAFLGRVRARLGGAVAA